MIIRITRKSLIPSLVAWMVLLIFPQAEALASEESVQIDIPIFEGGAGLSFFFQCAREYEKERPGIRVNLYGDPRIAEKMKIRVLEGSFPEITDAYLNYWAMIAEDKLLPLDEFLDGPNWEGDSTWRESFLPGSLDLYTHEGKTYGIPLPYYVVTVWYNKKMFRENGWKPAQSWEQFFKLCENIKASGMWPLAFQGRYMVYAQLYLRSAYFHLAGPRRYYARGRLEPGSFDNPESIRAMELVQKLALNYFQPGSMGMSHTEAQLEFFMGRTAMVTCGSWLKSEMLGKIPDGFEMGTFNLPVPSANTSDPSAIQVHSGFFFVFRESQHPRRAVDFLRFMTSRRMAGEFCRQRDIPVAVKGVNENNLSSDMKEVAAIIKAARTSFGQLPGDAFSQMSQCLDDIDFDLLTNRITPQRAAVMLEKRAMAVRRQQLNPNEVVVRHVWKPLLFIGLLATGIVYYLVTSLRRFSAARRTGLTHASKSPLEFGRANLALFIGPALLLYSVFVIVPCLKSLAWSVSRWNGLGKMTYAGLVHFVRLLFESDGFWIALSNNLFIMFVIPLFVLPLSLFLAACISRGLKGSGLFRVAFFFPNILGAVAATLLWMHMYNPQGGLVNMALVGLGRGMSGIGLQGLGSYLQGFAGFAWLAQNNLYWALIPMFIWAACGFNMILFLAAMESIPQSMYEAAEIDGASVWQQFRSITLPLIWPALSIAVVFMVIGGMKTFEVIWLLTNQSPTTGTHVIGTLMIHAMLVEFRVGEAAAIAVLLFLMVFFGSAATLRIMKRETVEF